jgi:4'-phosphopantetheinyl transferase
MKPSALNLFVADVTATTLPEPPAPRLLPSETHVWEFSLKATDPDYLVLKGRLCENELNRASRFHREADSRRFVVARGFLRSVLGSYVSADPASLQFHYSERGKPRLDIPSQDFRFSISHSGERALIAVSLGREVGVDIEKITPNTQCDKLAGRFFSSAEFEALMKIEQEDRIRSFFRYWSCKEAFLKAQGTGLSRSLSSFDVELGSRGARLAATRPDPSEAAAWSLLEIDSISGYAAAVVLEGQIAAASLFRYE